MHAWPFWKWRTEQRKVFQNFHTVINQFVADAHGDGGIILGNVADDLLQSAMAYGEKDYFAVHDCNAFTDVGQRHTLAGINVADDFIPSITGVFLLAPSVPVPVWELSQSCSAFRSLFSRWATASLNFNQCAQWQVKINPP